jgi:hypothetical protein
MTSGRRPMQCWLRLNCIYRSIAPHDTPPLSTWQDQARLGPPSRSDTSSLDDCCQDRLQRRDHQGGDDGQVHGTQ